MRVQDGPNAGKQAVAGAAGAFSLPGLAPSGMTVVASAANFVSASDGVTLTASRILNFTLTPTPIFTFSGVGDSVFTLPATVSRVRITARYTGSSSNFIVRIGGALVVNVIIGTSAIFGGNTTFDGTYLTAGGTVAITNSSGVAWTFTEVRP